MADYDFSSLNDKEFETLAADLLSCHLGCHVERFKAGPDGGVDERFFSSNGNEVIIQCKHWRKSGLAALLRSIENIEADKVRKLKPKRYIFVTSLELSRANKIKIKETYINFASIEDVIIHKIFAGRPRDIEDVKSIILKKPKFNSAYIISWLKAFNSTTKDKDFLKSFQDVLE